MLFGAADGATAGVARALPGEPALYDAVVDASSGAILYRANLTKEIANAEVYENHPGAAPPVTVDLEALGLTPGASVLDGQYSRAVGRPRRRRRHRRG